MGSEVIDHLNKLYCEIKNDIEDSRSKTVSEIKEYIDCIDNKVKTIETKISHLDREVRKRNVVIFGISEEFSDYWELEKFVCNFLLEKLTVDIDVKDIDFVRRIGKNIENRSRPILVGFISFRSKLMVIQNASKLKGSQIFIAQDFSKDVIAIRKNLQPQLTRARQEGKFATLKYDKLIVRDDVQPYNKKRQLSNSPPVQCDASRVDESMIKKNKISENLSLKPIVGQDTIQPLITSAGSRDLERVSTKGATALGT